MKTPIVILALLAALAAPTALADELLREVTEYCEMSGRFTEHCHYYTIDPENGPFIVKECDEYSGTQPSDVNDPPTTYCEGLGERFQ